MKNLIFAAMLLICGCEGSNATSRRQKVVEQMGTVDVQAVPNSSFCFVVRKSDGSIWYVEYTDAVEEKFSTTQLFAGK